MAEYDDRLVVVRGGGDIASGTIYKLVQCGFKVLVLETKAPSAIRRNVAFSECVYDGKHTIENMTCIKADNIEEAKKLLQEYGLALLIDEKAECLKELKPIAVVDAILAKRNLGTTRDFAPITVGLGPGFIAGEDVDAVIETMRGHTLGKVIYEGSAIPDTRIPGEIQGFTTERVIHAEAEGILRNVRSITDTVTKGEVIAVIEDSDGTTEVKATINGLIRGLIRDGYYVTKGFKIADIDPRINEYDNCFTISDKARCIAGGVVEAIMHMTNNMR